MWGTTNAVAATVSPQRWQQLMMGKKELNSNLECNIWSIRF